VYKELFGKECPFLDVQQEDNEEQAEEESSDDEEESSDEEEESSDEEDDVVVEDGFTVFIKELPGGPIHSLLVLIILSRISRLY